MGTVLPMRVYLDNNATTPVDPLVITAMQRALDPLFGNPASALHAWGWEAAALVKIAREQIADLITGEPDEITFTSGATESINLALFGMREAATKRIVLSAIEHQASLDCGRELAHRGFAIESIAVDNNGVVQLDELERTLRTAPTQLVSIVAANNEIGTLQDLPAIVRIGHAHGALVHLDCAQWCGKLPLDVKAVAVDLVSISAHKIYGPKGIGALWARRDIRHMIHPLIFGGGHEHGLRSGTLNVPGIVGFGKAAELAKLHLVSERNPIRTLTELFWHALSGKIPDLALNGPELQSRLPGNLNIRLPRPTSALLIARLASKVALSASSACTSALGHESHVLAAIGLSEGERAASLRVGIGRMNTEDEILFAAEEIAAQYRALV